MISQNKSTVLTISKGHLKVWIIIKGKINQETIFTLLDYFYKNSNQPPNYLIDQSCNGIEIDLIVTNLFYSEM